jgi:pimeloyl-ACP methyl ester carboxylesterase
MNHFSPLPEQDVLVKGIRIHMVMQEGNGLPIIFLHDSLGCIRLWRDFPQQVAALTGQAVYLYDRQGYGQSQAFSTQYRELDYMHREADTLIDFMDTCGLDKAALFGHSDGGSIALLAAAKYPQRIQAIITEGAHIFVEDITLNGIQEAVELYNTTALPRKLAKYHGDNTDPVFHAWADTWLRPDFRNWNIEDALHHISCPTLVLQGEEDEYGSPMQVQCIQEQVSGPVETWLIPGAKHTPHKEQPEVVLQRCVAFLQEQ